MWNANIMKKLRVLRAQWREMRGRVVEEDAMIAAS